MLLGAETSEYLVTQAVAEFLSKRFDGLIFSSVQARSGFNILLFGTAANVHVPHLPKGTTVTVECDRMTTDGLKVDYTVMEEPCKDKIDEPVQPETPLIESLMLERNTLKVHHVEAVT